MSLRGWGSVLTVYRVYSLDADGRISFGEELMAGDDQAAMALARELIPNAVKCELWQERRLVAMLTNQQWTIDPPIHPE